MDFNANNPENVRICDVCGEKPAVAQFRFVAGGVSHDGAVCELCAREAMGAAAVGAANMGSPTAQANRQRAQAAQRGAQTAALDRFGDDLTAEAREGRIDPVIGRDAEVEQVVEILSRRRKNNAALIGEAGVGKTAIAEGLALRSPGTRCRSHSRTCAWSRSTSLGWSPAPSSAAPSSSGSRPCSTRSSRRRAR